MATPCTNQSDTLAETLRAERRRLAANYDRAFAELDWLQTPVQPDGYTHGYQSYPCLFQPERTRQAVMARDPQAIKAINEARNAWMDRLQPRAMGLVIEWASLHQHELLADWELARRQETLNKIEPLE